MTTRRFFLKSILALSSIPFVGKVFAKQGVVPRSIHSTYSLGNWITIEAYPVPETCDELVKGMEAFANIGNPTIVRQCETGDDVVEYALGTSSTDNPEKLLCRWMWNMFMKQHRESPDGTLYWRMKPEFSRWNPANNETNPLKTSKIYMRYFYSGQGEDMFIYSRQKPLELV